MGFEPSVAIRLQPREVIVKTIPVIGLIQTVSFGFHGSKEYVEKVIVSDNGAGFLHRDNPGVDDDTDSCWK